MPREVPEDRIKTISISEIISKYIYSNNDLVKITKQQMIERLAKSIAERLFMFDKVLIKRRKSEGHREVLLYAQFDIIVPKGKPDEC
jgi:hypothetical protein